MNELSEHILTHLTEYERFIDKKTGDWKYESLVHVLFNAREELYLREVFFPKYFRAARLFRSFYDAHPEIQATHFGWESDPREYGMQGWFVEECEECGVQWHFNNMFEDFQDWFFQHHFEWQEDEPEEEELRALLKGVMAKRVLLRIRLFLMVDLGPKQLAFF